MEKKRSIGIVIFSILLFLGTLHPLLSRLFEASPYNYFKMTFYPLPEQIIQARYFVGSGILVLAAISAIGMLCQKNLFRKTALFVCFFNVYTYLIELPLVAYKNTPKVAERITLRLLERHSSESFESVSSLVWGLWSIMSVLDFGFYLALIYFLTRPKVKAQFE